MNRNYYFIGGRLLLLAVLSLSVRGFGAGNPPQIVPAAIAAPSGYLEISGVKAGVFDPGLWQSNKLNFVPDQRFPLLAPREGKFRNIYAPSAVQTRDGYRVFYGAWDGIPAGHDHIYSATTDFGFQNFSDRHAVLSPTLFDHACNVNALRLADGSFALFATIYPVDGKNRPGFFKSDATGTNWNGKPGEPYIVQPTDIATIAGYNYTNADINGMNVMLREADKYRLYFGDFKNPGGTYRASSSDGRQYQFESTAYSGPGFVNDVKKFRVGKTDYYLMGLHENGAQLWQTVSTNSLAFPSAQRLFANANATDRYIVALGWVTDGPQELAGRRLLGVLYGAGPVSSLDRNQIFARWLQKRIIFVTTEGSQFIGNEAVGPDRQLLQVPGGTALKGHFEIYGDDGETLITKSPTLTVRSGQSFELVQP